MKLHAIASPLVAAINPPIAGELHRNTGYTTSPAGKRVSTYADPEALSMQVQGLSAEELRQVDSLNIQGIKRAIHLPGDVQGVDRASGTGGDLVKFGDAAPGRLRNSTWLVALVMETWDSSEWCRVVVVKQNGA